MSNLETARGLDKVRDSCGGGHRIRMISTEEVFNNKWCNGEPTHTLVTYGCLSCGHRHEVKLPYKS
jgi:hypothetical protein